MPSMNKGMTIDELIRCQYAVEYECKHALRPIKTSHGLRFSSQSSKPSNNQGPQTKEYST